LADKKRDGSRVLHHQQSDERSADTNCRRHDVTFLIAFLSIRLDWRTGCLPEASGKETNMTQLEEATISTSSVNPSSVASIDLKLEVVVIPVSDVDRAKEFYARLGWRLDADFRFDKGLRVIQFTPPGSGSSIQFGTKVTSAAPGSAQNLYLVVSDVVAAREQLAARGAGVSEVFHAGTPGAHFQPEGSSDRLSGPAPDRMSYGSYATFADPDGNQWILQEVTTRLPGRVDSRETAFATVNDLASAFRRASSAHGEHEKRIGQHDPNWPDWYAAYMVAEQAGQRLPE
jgi:catechol 2,3-dioxygenase-like lactoylglutathione lyase family enzyme